MKTAHQNIETIGPRASAISHCKLVDVTQTAFEAGFRCSVALSSAAWEVIRCIPRRWEEYESFYGRLEHVLVVANYAMYENRKGGDEILFLSDLTTDTGTSQVFLAKKVIGDDGRLSVNIYLGDE